MNPVTGALHTVRVLGRSGLLRPPRPDRLLRTGLALRHWGVSVAAGFAAAGARHGTRVALVDERGTLTWGELDRRSNAVARGLAGLGVEPGDTVAVMCRNHRGFVDATAALAKLGAHTLYLNTSFAGPQLREVTAREAASTLILDEDFVPLLDGDGVRTVAAWTDDPPPGGPTLDALAAGDPTPPPPPPEPGRTVILTSGTTGSPKGASRAQRTGASSAVALLERIPYRSGDTMVIAAPLFHSWGFGNLMVAMVLGSTIVLARRFDPEATLAAVAHHRATVLVAVPVMLQRILELPAATRRRYDTSSLRVVPLSGSAIPGRLAPRFMDEFGDVVYNLYGSTEVAWATIATPADLRDAPSTAGRPPWGTEVRIVGPDGGDLPVGATGRIFVRNDALFEGYTSGDSKETIDGFMSTGDTGHFDADGRLFVDGREDEMIVSGGENVYPHEVEDLLALHPDVEEAAVVGVPDPEFGARLKAYVVRRAGASIDTDGVRAHVRANLARFKVPRDVEFVATLPRNATGKVVKRELPGGGP